MWGCYGAGQSITRGPAVPSGRPAPVVLAGRDIAGSAEVAEDGWLRPYGNQVNDWDFEFRPLQVPQAVAHRYTSFETVETILRAAPGREAGFKANFTDRLNACISAAEARIDREMGRQFTLSAQDTRTFRINTPLVIEVDDIDLAHPVSISYEGRPVAATQYHIRNSVKSYNVGYFVRPARRSLFRYQDWQPRIGYNIEVSARFGWPSIPAEVADYAGRLAAAIFDSDSARAGLVGIGDGMAYGRTPGKDLWMNLRHLQRQVGVG